MSEKTEAMTAERIAEIKAREGKATPAPWVVDLPDWGECNGISSKNGTQILNAGSCIPDPQTAVDYGGTVHDWKEEIYDYGVHKWDDAVFIAHARQDIPDLLAEVERLRAENKRLEKSIDWLVSKRFPCPRDGSQCYKEIAIRNDTTYAENVCEQHWRDAALRAAMKEEEGETMSDRSDEALRERLELAKKATDGPWKSVEVLFRKKNFEPSYVVKDGDGRTIVDIISVAAYQATARHIAANHPEVVRADLEEILALRAEVARLRAREEWLIGHLAEGDAYEWRCPNVKDEPWPWATCDSCNAGSVESRKRCWRKAAEMETREKQGESGEVPENQGGIRPCPECGSPAEMDNSPWDKKTPFFVVCTNKRCLACGPNAESKEKAIEAWNKQ